MKTNLLLHTHNNCSISQCSASDSLGVLASQMEIARYVGRQGIHVISKATLLYTAMHTCVEFMIQLNGTTSIH